MGGGTSSPALAPKASADKSTTQSAPETTDQGTNKVVTPEVKEVTPEVKEDIAPSAQVVASVPIVTVPTYRVVTPVAPHFAPSIEGIIAPAPGAYKPVPSNPNTKDGGIVAPAPGGSPVTPDVPKEVDHLAEAQAKLLVARDKLAKASADLASLQATRDAVAEELMMAKGRLAEAQKVLDEAKATLQELRAANAEYIQAQARLAETTKAVQEHEARLVALNAALTKAQGTHTTAQDNLATARAEAETATANFTKAKQARNEAVTAYNEAVKAEQANPTGPIDWTASSKQDKAKIIALAIMEKWNAYRASEGLEAIAFHDDIVNTSVAHSERMAGDFGFNHDMNIRLDGYSYYTYMENIAISGYFDETGVDVAEQVDGIFSGWKASKGHNANLLNGSINAGGVGIYIDDEGNIFATMRGFALTDADEHTDFFAPKSGQDSYDLNIEENTEAREDSPHNYTHARNFNKIETTEERVVDVTRAPREIDSSAKDEAEKAYNEAKMAKDKAEDAVAKAEAEVATAQVAMDEAQDAIQIESGKTEGLNEAKADAQAEADKYPAPGGLPEAEQAVATTQGIVDATAKEVADAEAKAQQSEANVEAKKADVAKAQVEVDKAEQAVDALTPKN
ncbi:SCP-like protein [Gleimia coleocanis DSM 15436]|uniref:SCP-like protein n=1 Tax=Gleimia coleocanis DSM 15436 TaxID=525245 RepID=C0W2A3_9ACTO|nr:CAP domain-containing protein [Gleimia coleocanis]EEH63194.1 SCP-like protein [Gleimia coleocanis DSM 15436]